MSSEASSSRPKKISSSFVARVRQSALTGLLAIVLAGGVFSPDAGEGITAAVAAIPPNDRSDVTVVALAPTDVAVDVPYETAALTPAIDDISDEAPAEAVPETPAFDDVPADDLVQLLKAGLTNGGEKREPALPKFAADYRALRRLAALIDLPRLPESTAVVGIASTYNPFRDGPMEGGPQTASGELYDPQGWSAAIQTKLRGQFGGVRYGRLYQPTFALVECGDKQAIVKINDVGPLRPGRIIDLNERAMRYFDPFLRRGLLQDVRVTLLPGEDWTPGPVGGAALIRTAGNL